MNDIWTYKVKLEDVPMVEDFANVFLDKLPSLSLEKEIEFDIDLVLRTHSISLLPYIMTPTELKELKT